MRGLPCSLISPGSSFQTGLANGGPAGLIYGFLFAWLGTGLQALVMGEMGSMIPLAGGYYNWLEAMKSSPRVL